MQGRWHVVLSSCFSCQNFNHPYPALRLSATLAFRNKVIILFQVFDQVQGLLTCFFFDLGGKLFQQPHWHVEHSNSDGCTLSVYPLARCLSSQHSVSCSLLRSLTHCELFHSRFMFGSWLTGTLTNWQSVWHRHGTFCPLRLELTLSRLPQQLLLVQYYYKSSNDHWSIKLMVNGSFFVLSISLTPCY
jgi:hypothetical protein